MRHAMQIADAWLPLLLFVPWGIILLRNSRSLWTAARPDSTTTWIALIVLTVSGFCLRMSMAPHVPYTFDDEFFHPDIARNLFHEHRFVFKVSDIHPPRIANYLPQWMPIYHSLLAAWSLLQGIGIEAASRLNVWIGTLTVPASFAVGRMLFRRNRPSLILCAMVAFMPLHIKFCGAANTEPLSVFFIALTIGFAAWRYTAFMPGNPDSTDGSSDARRGTPAGVLVILTGLIASMTRIENSLLLAPILCAEAYMAFIRRRVTPGEQYSLLACAVGAGALVVLQALVSYNSYDYWRAAVAGLPWRSPFLFLVSNPLWPPALTAAAVVGAASWKTGRFRTGVLFICIAAAMYAVYTVVHSLDVNVGDFHRYNLQTMLLFMIPAAVAIDSMFSVRSLFMRASAVIIVLALAISTLASYPAVRSHYWPTKLEEWRWLRENRNAAPAESVVVTEAPFLVRTTTGRRTVHAQLFLQDPTCRPATIVFYKSSRERCDPSIDIQDVLKTAFAATPLSTAVIGGETVGFYRLDPLPAKGCLPETKLQESVNSAKKEQ